MQIVKTDLVLRLKNRCLLREIQVKVPLVTKYNLILGDSASGKTVLEIAYDDYRSSNGLDIIDYAKNKWRYLNSVVLLDYLSDDTKSYDIILVGEELSRLMNNILCDKNNFRHESLTTALKDATCKFIFMSRHMGTLPITSKSLFELVNNNDTNVLQVVHKDNPFLSKEVT